MRLNTASERHRSSMLKPFFTESDKQFHAQIVVSNKVIFPILHPEKQLIFAQTNP